jgi:hypothetical protein
MDTRRFLATVALMLAALSFANVAAPVNLLTLAVIVLAVAVLV